MNGLANRPNSILFNRVAGYRDERAATDTPYIISSPSSREKRRERKKEDEIKGRIELERRAG